MQTAITNMGYVNILPPRTCTKCQIYTTMLTVNRPEGIVSKKIGVSCKMLEDRLRNITHTMEIREEYYVNLSITN